MIMILNYQKIRLKSVTLNNSIDDFVITTWAKVVSIYCSKNHLQIGKYLGNMNMIETYLHLYLWLERSKYNKIYIWFKNVSVMLSWDNQTMMKSSFNSFIYFLLQFLAMLTFPLKYIPSSHKINNKTWNKNNLICLQTLTCHASDCRGMPTKRK